MVQDILSFSFVSSLVYEVSILPSVITQLRNNSHINHLTSFCLFVTLRFTLSVDLKSDRT